MANEKTPLLALQQQGNIQENGFPSSLRNRKTAGTVAGLLLLAFLLTICCQKSSAPQHLCALLGVAEPIYNAETDIETLVCWETRIFFAVDDALQNDELTLNNPAVAKVVFPNETIVLDEIDEEERTDDYVLLTECPGAEGVGFKVRGGSAANETKRIELKTADTPNNNTPSGSNLKLWTKSSQQVFGTKLDRQVFLNFLATFDGSEKHPQADAVAKYISARRPIRLVRTAKRRQFAVLDQGNVSVQEAVVQFKLMDNNASFGSSSDKVVTMKSWSAEGTEETALLRSIAGQWEDRFAAAVQAAGLTTADQPEMWVASYPEMILKIPGLLAEQNNN